MLDKKNQSHDVHGCLKPVNTHGLDLSGRFLAGRST